MLHKDLVRIKVSRIVILPHKAARDAQDNTEQFPSTDSSLCPDFGQMLQQQQVLLMRLLNQQDEIQEKQKLFEKRLEGIEEQVTNAVQSASSSSSSPTGSQDKPKRVVSRRLSVRKLTPTPAPGLFTIVSFPLQAKVTSVHDNLHEEEKFNPQEGYTICNAVIHVSLLTISVA